MRAVAILALATATCLTAGCAARSYFSPVEVTRFSAAPASPIPPGPIAVQQAAGVDPASAEFAIYRSAVAKALETAGFQTAGSDAPYVALVQVDRLVSAPGERRGPVSVGGGASTGTYGSGVGLGVGINLSPPPAGEIRMQMAVSIRPAGGGDAIWEGRAGFTATDNSEYADAPAAAARLATALFKDFPGNSGETIEVE